MPGVKGNDAIAELGEKSQRPLIAPKN